MVLDGCVITQIAFNGKQGQSDLMMEIEALRTELKRTQEELDNKHMEVSLYNFSLL